MNKTLSFIKLDFLTVKPYTIRQFLILLICPIVLTINSGGGTSGIIIFTFFALIMGMYPFSIGERSNIDGLYTTLSIKRDTVVLGRYLFILAVDISFGLIANIFTFIIRAAMQKPFGVWSHFTVTVIMLMICTILQAVQLPVFFKLGYNKAKFLAYLPALGIPIMYIVPSMFLSDEIMDSFFEWLAANQFLTAVLAAVIWIILIIISYLISVSFYKKRDF